MIKIKKEIVHGALVKFIDQITETMPDQKYKFLLGGLSVFATLKSVDKINETLKFVSDEEGLVDLDLLEQMVDGAFKASDGKIQIDLFNNPGSLISYFIKPITLTVQKDDISRIIQEMKQNATKTEVTIEQQNTINNKV